ncbi:MAG: hypothetical protein FWD77_03770 [Betaproteobacteria bacterium]|nr:hypothetical protein [Betaproteobacteria bacterium]
MNEINRHVRELVRVLLSMPKNSVRPANQNAPTGGTTPFATVLIPTLQATGVDDVRLKDEAAPSLNVEESAVGQRAFMASVNFYGKDAFTRACRLHALLRMPHATERVQSMGLGLVRMSVARDLSAVVNSLWEERGQIDIDFHLIAKETLSVPTFGTFPMAIHTEPPPPTTRSFELHERKTP